MKKLLIFALLLVPVFAEAGVISEKDLKNGELRIEREMDESGQFTGHFKASFWCEKDKGQGLSLCEDLGRHNVEKVKEQLEQEIKDNNALIKKIEAAEALTLLVSMIGFMLLFISPPVGAALFMGGAIATGVVVGVDEFSVKDGFPLQAVVSASGSDDRVLVKDIRDVRRAMERILERREGTVTNPAVLSGKDFALKQETLPSKEISAPRQEEGEGAVQSAF